MDTRGRRERGGDDQEADTIHMRRGDAKGIRDGSRTARRAARLIISLYYCIIKQTRCYLPREPVCFYGILVEHRQGSHRASCDAGIELHRHDVGRVFIQLYLTLSFN